MSSKMISRPICSWCFETSGAMAMFRVASRSSGWRRPFPFGLPFPLTCGDAVRTQGELVDMMDADFPAHAFELIGQIGGKQLRQPPPHRPLARDPAQLFDLRVPAFHPVFQVGGQDADIDGFDDIFVELLQPLVLFHFALQRTVERGVLDGDADVAAQRDQQFHVHARKIVAIGSPADAHVGDGAAADRAGQIIGEVQFRDGGAHRRPASRAKPHPADGGSVRRTGTIAAVPSSEN